MRVWIKQGVMGDLTTIARKGLGRVAKLFSQHGQELYITSIREGTHSPGSLHYDGNAFDIQPNDQVSLKSIKEALGTSWDVVDEGNHIHCEYDPK